MENKSVIIGIILFCILIIYLYFVVLFLEKNFLWVLPIFYLIFFVVRDSKEGEKDLDKRLLLRNGEKMKSEW